MCPKNSRRKREVSFYWNQAWQ